SPSSPPSRGRVQPPASSAARSPARAASAAERRPAERAKPLLPRIDRLLAYHVPLGNRRHRIPVSLPKDPNDLLFREPRFLHPAPSWRPVSQLIDGPKTRQQVIAKTRS